MIPKIIHYCWLSGDPYPEKIQRCIDSWHQFLPDYQFILWDRNRFDIQSVQWVEEAYLNKKYAFAADYIRAYALAHYGGIYLDSDVEVVRPFDDLLHLPYFMGTERYAKSGAIEAAVVGTEKGLPFYTTLLHYYDHRSFVKEDGSLDMWPLPNIFRLVAQQLGLEQKHISSPAEFDPNPQILNILPVDYFSPKDNRVNKIRRTSRTYAIHHFGGTWKPATQAGFADRLHQLVGDQLYYNLFATPYFFLKDRLR